MRHPFLLTILVGIAMLLGWFFSLNMAFRSAQTLLLDGFLFISLLYLVYRDLKEYILPDWVTLPLIPIGLLVAYWGETGQNESAFSVNLVTVIATGAFFLLFREVYMRLRKRDGLGLGDIKLFTAMGAWLGPYGLVIAVFISAFLGLLFSIPFLVASKSDFGKYEIPFGPFICLGFWAVWLGIVPLLSF